MLEGLDTEDVEGPQPHFLNAKNDIVTTETKSIDFTNIENVSLGNDTVDQNRHIIGAKQEGIQYRDQKVSGHGSDVSWAPPIQVANALRQTQSGGDQTPSRGPPTVDVSNSPQPATPAGFYRCGFQGCSFGTLLSGDFGNHLSNSHSSSERFPCSHCGCEEHNADSLLEHFNHHLDEMSRSYFCTEVCEFNSRDVDEVLRHILLAHPDTRNIICWSCGDRYESIHNFLSHVKDNTLRIVRCSYCTAKDTHENRLFQHMALSHPYKPRSIRSEKVLLCQERKKWGFRQTSLFSFPPTPDDTRSSFSATGKSPKSERIPHQARGCPTTGINSTKRCRRRRCNIRFTTGGRRGV
ncbi:hypothetical protein BaRGS_00021326 [Batillaria attramentaria]|uniref:C2H2-type domain-containing protein n=1 Tax=Batillaria attramentaria TaxID=370345 RepID=A0ABD0KJW9_9CAEN